MKTRRDKEDKEESEDRGQLQTIYRRLDTS